VIALIVGVFYYWRWTAIKQQVRQRLVESDEPIVDSIFAERPFARRYRWIPWLVGLVLGFFLSIVFDWPVNISVGVSVSMALLGLELDAWIFEYRLTRIETQLADTIDVVVASLSSGSSLQASLIEAADFSQQPLKTVLLETVARLRLGDAPSDVFQTLGIRVPSESFQLLSTSLIVNWEMGGGLAETLAALGKTIRDRIVISRQVRALSAQGRLTTLTVLAVIWFMAAMMWQADGARFVNFVTSVVGSWLVAVSLFLQGIGIALVSRISRPTV
jgi:tight adherence protein B